MAIVAIFDHIDRPVWEKLPDHVPLGAEFSVDIDYDLVFLVAEFVAIDPPVEFVSEAFLDFLWGYDGVVE